MAYLGTLDQWEAGHTSRNSEMIVGDEDDDRFNDRMGIGQTTNDRNTDSRVCTNVS